MHANRIFWTLSWSDRNTDPYLLDLYTYFCTMHSLDSRFSTTQYFGNPKLGGSGATFKLDSEHKIG